MRMRNRWTGRAFGHVQSRFFEAYFLNCILFAISFPVPFLRYYFPIVFFVVSLMKCVLFGSDSLLRAHGDAHRMDWIGHLALWPLALGPLPAPGRSPFRTSKRRPGRGWAAHGGHSNTSCCAGPGEWLTDPTHDTEPTLKANELYQ